MTATKEEIREIENRVREEMVKETKQAFRKEIKKAKEESMKIMKRTAKLQKEINYAKLPEKVKSAIEPIDYELDIETKLTWDGRQFVVRIPKEIVDGCKITKQNRMLFKFVKSSPLSNKAQDKPKLEISVI